MRQWSRFRDIYLELLESGQYIAYLYEGEARFVASGNTPTEAVGNLVQTYPGKFNIAIRWSVEER